MITAHQLEVRAGARLLMDGVTFRVGPGDRVGLVGRNGAGKTTLTRILAGEGVPASGKVTTTGSVGYLSQDPRTGDLGVLARDRILSARGLDAVVRRLRDAEAKMASDDPAVAEKAMRRYTAADTDLHASGGYAAESEAARIAASLGIEDRLLGQPLAPCPAASGDGSSWPGSCSPVRRRCSSTSPPTTSTPTRSSGCASSSARTRAVWS